MPQISQRSALLTDSLPLLISAKAKRMAAAGEDIINLSVGEPDFPSPELVKSAGVEAIGSNFTRYTAARGIPELRGAIADSLAADHGLEYTPEEIVVTNGAKQAIASTLLAVVNAGDEVIYMPPCYASYVDLIALAGGNPVPVELRAEEGFGVNLDRLEQAITPRTSAIILNNPNNPTGAASTPGEVDEIGKLLREKDLWVLADEIYEKLRYDGKRHRSLAAAEGMRERTALINGVSKYYAMTGWRLGFLAAPRSLADVVAKFQSQITGSPNAISQKAALAAYSGECTEPEEMVRVFAQRAKRISALLSEIPDLPLVKPNGAFYAFPDVRAYLGRRTPGGQVIEDSLELCQWLLEAHHVALIPGSAFGAEGFVRFSFAASEEEIEEGVRRFGKGLQELR